MFKFLLILLIISTSQARAKDDNEDSLIQLVCTGELVMTFPFSSKPSKVFSKSPLSLSIYPSTGVAELHILPFGSYDFSAPFIFKKNGSNFLFKSEKDRDVYSQSANVLLDRNTGLLNVIEIYEHKIDIEINMTTSGVYQCKKVEQPIF